MQTKDCGAGCGCGGDATPAGGISRRTFLVHGSLAAVSVALVACAAGGPTAPDSVSLTVSLADYPALADVGGVAYVSAGGSPLAIVRIDASTFATVSRICPHQGGRVNATGSGFLCPNHGAQFDDQGHWVGGQRTGSLKAYPTSYDATTQSLTIG